MKIAFITHQFPGVRGGGVGTYVLQAAGALANAGHAVQIFTFTLSPDVRAAVPQNIQLHEVDDLAVYVARDAVPKEIVPLIESGGEAAYRFALATLLCLGVREYHAEGRWGEQYGGLDIVEAPEYEALGLPLLAVPPDERGDLPVVTHLHLCSAVARRGNSVVATAEDALIDAAEFGAISCADARCAPSQNIVDETARFTEVPRDVAIFPHPLNVPQSFTEVPRDGPVLFVGRLEPRKGTALMPAAFNAFLRENPAARIRLVGTDTQWGGASIEEQITEQLDPVVRGRVTFVGEKSPQQVQEEFAACRFSICPSLLESFGYVAAESLLAGRAVVVSSDMAAAEVVGDAGVVFRRGSAEGLAQAMQMLWRDPSLCAELSRKAFARAQHLFDPNRTVTARVAFYQSVIERIRQRGHDPVSHIAAEKIVEQLKSGGSALSPGARLVSLLDQLDPTGGAKVMLYGAGRHTLRLLVERKRWESRGHSIVGLIDDHPRYAKSPDYLGLPICSAAALIERKNHGEFIPPIILSSDTFQEAFWQKTADLRAMGVAVHRLYD